MYEDGNNEHLTCPVCGCPELGGCTHWIALIDWTFEIIDDTSPINDEAFNFGKQLGNDDLHDAWFELFQGNNLRIVQQALLLAGAKEQTGSCFFPPAGLSAESVFFCGRPGENHPENDPYAGAAHLKSLLTALANGFGVRKMKTFDIDSNVGDDCLR